MNHYDFEVKTLGHLLRRVAIDYVRYGYYRYVVREIPPGKDPRGIDRKLIEAYDITRCRSTRRHRKRAGVAVVALVRHRHRFVLLATKGTLPAFDKLSSNDIRESPLHIDCYTVGVLGSGAVCIRVEKRVWQPVSRKLMAQGLHDRDKVTDLLESLPFYRFPGVMVQLFTLTQEINRRRKLAGLQKVRPDIRPRLGGLYREHYHRHLG